MNRLYSGIALTVLLAASGCASHAPVRGDAPPVGVADAAPAVEAGSDEGANAAPVLAETPNAEAGAAGIAEGTPDAAEDDFAAIYGTDAATDTGSANRFAALDPWEPMNRRVHAFNNVVDRVVARPVARAYVTVIPQPLRTGVSNFFDNLGAPLAIANLLMQGRPSEAVEVFGRFLVNTTAGLGGLFDPATKALKMHRHSSDFGRVLARWGWQQSRYVELPFLGPHTLRDTLGSVGDLSLSPLTYVRDDQTRLSIQALRVVDLRAGILSLDALRDDAPDEYVLTRDAWLARRHYLVDTDRSHRDEGSETLPAYLLEDEPAAAPEQPPQP